MAAHGGSISPLTSVLLCFLLSPVSPSAHRFVVTLLDSKSTEMCYYTCGVLTNLALDSPTRVKLAQEGAAAK